MQDTSGHAYYMLPRRIRRGRQSSNTEPSSGEPSGFPVGEGSGHAATDPERTSVLERIKIATDAATRALGALFAVGAVVVVVVVGGVTRVTVGTTTAATAGGTTVVTVEATVGGTTTTRTIIVLVIEIAVILLNRTTATRTIIIAIVTIVTIEIAISMIVTVETAVITTTTAARAATTVITATAGTATTIVAIAAAAAASASTGFLILEARDGQGDLAAIVHTLHDDLDGVAFLEHILDGVDTLAVGEVADLGDVQQTVGARGEVHECA